MRFARGIPQSDWEMFEEFLDGRKIKYIAGSHGISTRSVHKKFNKINDLLKIACD